MMEHAAVRGGLGAHWEALYFHLNLLNEQAASLSRGLDALAADGS